jgi:hypothetical protein
VGRPRGTWDRKRLILAIKMTLGVVVVIAVGRHVARTWAELNREGELPRLDLGWLAASAGLYVGGLVLFGLWYWRIVAASATPIGGLAAVRAYIISHLGKYVPGKATVVLLRVGFSAPFGARPATSAFAAMYETLVMMASGSLIAAAGFALGPSRTAVLPLPGVGPVTVPLAWLALGPGLGFTALAMPQVFPRLSRLMSLPFPGVGPDALPRFRHRLLAEGMLWSLGGWTFWGLSQVAVIRALVPEGLPPSAWTIAVASVALATVAGFVVAIAPGGLGPREWVLYTALGSTGIIDEPRAVLAAVVLRLAWVLGELASAAALAPLRPPRPVGAATDAPAEGQAEVSLLNSP